MKYINLKDSHLQLYKRENSNFWQIKFKLPKEKAIRKSSGTKILKEAKKVALKKYNEISDTKENNINLSAKYNYKKYHLIESKNLSKKDIDCFQHKGLELKYDFNLNPIFIYCNYTIQYTRGNADTPLQSFSREGGNQDPVAKLIPMSWDQRHTFNTTFAYSQNGFGITTTAYYNSGTPYTFEPISESETALINLLPNNDYKPSNYNIDLKGHYQFLSSDDLEVKLSFSIYNLFDTLNDMFVYAKTGRAYSNIVSTTEIQAYRSTFTDIYDQYENPAMYSAPRQIKLSLSINYK